MFGKKEMRTYVRKELLHQLTETDYGDSFVTGLVTSILDYEGYEDFCTKAEMKELENKEDGSLEKFEEQMGTYVREAADEILRDLTKLLG